MRFTLPAALFAALFLLLVSWAQGAPGSGSVLGQQGSDLPPPLPIGPAPATQAPPPEPVRAMPEPSRDLGVGTITATPLPPPGERPATPPPVAAAPAETGAPISLAPARPPVIAKAPAAGKTKSKTREQEKAPVTGRLPAPDLPPGSQPADYLRAARGAVAANRMGEARVALEMAETRLLDRAVDAGTEHDPSGDLAVKQITEALNALTANDRPGCLRYIEFASQTIGAPLN